MGLLDRLSRLLRSNVNSLTSSAEDPEKLLLQAVDTLQHELISMRQAVAQAIATQKRTERQTHQADKLAQEWLSRAQLALQKDNERMAREALTYRQSYLETSQSLKKQEAQQREVVQRLKSNLHLLERQLANARTQKDLYISRAKAAQSSARLYALMDQFATDGLQKAFEHAESRVLDLEAQAEIARLAGQNSLEHQFAQLESQDMVEHQLFHLKAQLNKPQNPK